MHFNGVLRLEPHLACLVQAIADGNGTIKRVGIVRVQGKIPRCTVWCVLVHRRWTGGWVGGDQAKYRLERTKSSAGDGGSPRLSSRNSRPPSRSPL